MVCTWYYTVNGLSNTFSWRSGHRERAVKRNAHRFPADFIFRLTKEEDAALRCQIGTSNGRGGRRYLPYAFTEHGAIMAATVLNSPRAVQMSVFVVRAFVRMRAALADTRELSCKLAALEQKVKARFPVVLRPARPECAKTPVKATNSPNPAC